MNCITFHLFCFILLYKIMLLNSRFFWFENVWNWGLEMGCDTKWGKGQIKESSGIPSTARRIILGPCQRNPTQNMLKFV